jgi:KaiC/GvpD/RAD55 family RecA-like ATPase
VEALPEHINATILEANKLIDRYEDNLESERHIKAVKRGKVLLKLLSTINRPEMNLWLSEAEPDGNFYNFHKYRIVKKKSFKKDLIDIKNIPEFTEDLFSKVHETNVALRIINQYSLSTSAKVDFENIKALYPFFKYYLGKLNNVVDRPEYHTGEIYYRDDMTGVAKDISLIDLYMTQKNIDNEEEAINELADKETFEVPTEFHKPIKLDKRRHWSFKLMKYDINKFERDPQYQYIEFKDRDMLLGHVLVDSKGIFAPETFWAKNINFQGHPLHVPFPESNPLWNLDLIQQNKDADIILTDSLCLAFKNYEDKCKKIEYLKSEIRNLKNSLISKYHYDNVDFTQELVDYFEDKIEGKIIMGDYTLYNKISCELAAIANLNFRWKEKYEPLNEQGKKLFFKCLLSKRAKYGVNYNHYYIDDFKSYNYDKKNQNVEVFFPVFDGFYSMMSEYIEKQINKDEDTIKNIQKELENQTDFIWSSWYGGHHTFKDVRLRALKGRKVYYLIRHKLKKEYLTALALHSRLKELKTEVTFISSKAIDHSSKHSFGKIPKEAIISVDKLKKRFNITDKDIKKFLSNEADPVNIDTPYVYDPQKKLEALPLNDFLLAPLIREKSISLLYSEPGVGKSWLALSIAQSLYYGCSTFMSKIGWQARSPKRVLIIDSEMSEYSFLNRLKLLKKHYETMGDAKQVKPKGLQYKLVAHEDWDLISSSSEHRRKITNWLKLGTKDQVDFLILDNLSTLSGFSDSAKSWKNLFEWLQWLREKGCSSLIIHHANKTTGDQRGSSLKAATVDNIIRATKALPGKKNNLAVTLKIEKGRDAYGDALDSFTVMLDKVNDDEVAWKTPHAKGCKSFSTAERNNNIHRVAISEVFNQKIIADYFGIEAPTLKGIIDIQQKEKNRDIAKEVQKAINKHKLNKEEQKKLIKDFTKIIKKNYNNKFEAGK